MTLRAYPVYGEHDDNYGDPLTQDWFYWNNKGNWFRILPEIIIIAMVEVSWIELLLFVTQYWGQQDHGGGGVAM